MPTIPSDSKTLIRYGDTELWYASGSDGTWSLPLHVRWRKDADSDTHYGLVQPAVCLYPSQNLLVDAILQFHSILHNRKDQWLVERRMVETLIHKAPGITPSFYYKWPDDSMPMIPATSKPMHVESYEATREGTNSQTESFIKQVCAHYNLPNSIVRIVLRAISAEAITWMVEQRRSLNLGFATLVAVPFRANWKEIVAAKMKHYKLSTMFNLPKREKRIALEEAGLPQALCSPDNIGLKGNPRRRLHYTIEAIPMNQFENGVSVIEAKRKSCGQISYVASFEKTVESLYGYILDALENYMRKINAPFAKVSESSTTGQLRFLPTSGNKARVRGIPIRKLPVAIVPPRSNFSVFGEQGPKSIVYAKAPPVQALPAVPQEANDMRGRDEHGGVVESRQEGSVRVLLQDADKGAPEGEPVLPCSTATDGDALRVG